LGVSSHDIKVPAALAATQARYRGEEGRAWVAGLPDLAAGLLDRWRLRLDGSARCGAVALVLPVRTADDRPAVLKLQHVDDETAGEPTALRVWDGRGSVRLLDHDLPSGTMLLERLDATRTLSSIADAERALTILGSLLARLVSVPAPPGIRRLQPIAEQLLKRAPEAVARLAGADDRRLARGCAAAVASVLPVTDDRLLHWDLHYDNVLGGDREPWLAIDPKPLAGDPGFELLPALWNRWDDVTASGGVARAVRRRFDLMTEVLGLDRQRAACWTLGRVLQETLWAVAEGASAIRPSHAAIGWALLPSTGRPSPRRSFSAPRRTGASPTTPGRPRRR
jgi:streptomycin 6-kinase